MLLYSKRGELSVDEDSPKSFIRDSLRMRLVKEIAYLTASTDFLERCFLVDDKKNGKLFLDKDSIKNLSERKLGYDLSVHFNFNPFSLQWSSNNDDYALFDLIEIILIFSKEETRDSVRTRLQRHFLEEGDQYRIHDFLIARKNAAGLQPFIPFLKDEVLKSRLSQYYTILLEPEGNYELLARISADIIQFLFSGNEQRDTKNHAEQLIHKIAEKSVTMNDVEFFSSLLNECVLNAKKLSNQISKIRHTDRSTLLVDNPAIFKLISSSNICLAEAVIFASPEEYFFGQKAIDFKNEYISEYKIPVNGWVIRKPTEIEYPDVISSDGIPF